MKKVLLLVAVVAFSFTLPSCKKCTTCVGTYQTTDLDGEVTNETFTYPETCGKKKDLDAIEATCKLAYTSCTCNKS